MDKHLWTRHADQPCWCGEWHTLREAWRLNREHFGSNVEQQS